MVHTKNDPENLQFIYSASSTEELQPCNICIHVFLYKKTKRIEHFDIPQLVWLHISLNILPSRPIPIKFN